MQKQAHKNTDGASYKGIPVHAAPGLHEAVIEHIAASASEKRILELGCGSGALTLRLVENGFQVRAVDLSLDSFAAEVEALELDLNGDFAEILSDQDTDLVVAVEVIEHLENPQHFLRQIARLMKPETRLWLSFPNMLLYLNGWLFPKDGTFAFWNEQQYWEMGHQTLLPAWLFEQHLKKAGLRPLARHFVAPADLKESHGNPLKRLISRGILEIMLLLFRSVSRQQRLASCVLYQIALDDRSPSNS